MEDNEPKLENPEAVVDNPVPENVSIAKLSILNSLKEAQMDLSQAQYRRRASFAMYQSDEIEVQKREARVKLLESLAKDVG